MLYEDGSLPGVLRPCRQKTTDLERAHPASSSSTASTSLKSFSICGGVSEKIIAAGYPVLLVDGPGTGEAIRFRGLDNLRHDYEVAGSAAIDYLETTSRTSTSSRIGVMAISLGGYYAPRCASMEPRFKACVAWGAMLGLPQRREEAPDRGRLSRHVTLGAGTPHQLNPRRRFA